MEESWRKTCFGALMFLLLQAAAANAEIQPPEVGRTTTYKCSGPWGANHTYTVSEVNGGVFRVEIDRDGKPQWVEKPVNALGTTLFKRRQRNDGKGVRKQKLDEGLLAQYAKLEPGSEFKFNVRERHNEGRWEWGYKIKVGQPETINHEILGEIEVVSVSESRKVWKGGYSSEMTVLLYPAKGMSIGWTYKDRDGTQECKLVGVN